MTNLATNLITTATEHPEQDEGPRPACGRGPSRLTFG